MRLPSRGYELDPPKGHRNPYFKVVWLLCSYHTGDENNQSKL